MKEAELRSVDWLQFDHDFHLSVLLRLLEIPIALRQVT